MIHNKVFTVGTRRELRQCTDHRIGRSRNCIFSALAWIDDTTTSAVAQKYSGRRIRFA